MLAQRTQQHWTPATRHNSCRTRLATSQARCRSQRAVVRATSRQAGPSPPWALMFDLRERETVWSDANKARLVAMVAARDSGLSYEEVDGSLTSLMLLLPDLSVAGLSPALLSQLLAALPQLPSRLINLRAMLPPGTDISRVTAGRLQILFAPLAQLRATAEALTQQLGPQALRRLVEAQPLALEEGCVEAVLAEMRRLMPPGTDVVRLLGSDPSWLLRAQAGQQWLGEHPDSDGQAIDLRF